MHSYLGCPFPRSRLGKSRLQSTACHVFFSTIPALPGDFLRGHPSARLAVPSARGECAEMHPIVPMIQALTKHVKQLVALMDELRETT